MAAAMVVTPVAAATVVVTSSTIDSAFKAAHAGDVLQLVGTFAGADLRDRSFTHAVTLDASHALFTSTLILRDITNLKVSGGTFRIADAPLHSAGSVVYGGANVWFDKTVASGAGSEYGIEFAGTTNAKVSNGAFTGFRAGVVLSGVQTGLLTHNRVTAAVSDGIDIGDSHFVTASYNSCSAGQPGPGVHPDCIQLWSVTGRPVQSDNIVTHNTATGPTQGFTSFSFGGGGERIQLTNNVVATSDSQGVACYDCYDSTITGNNVSTMPGSAHETNIAVVGGGNNLVANNKIAPYTPPRPVPNAPLPLGFDTASDPVDGSGWPGERDGIITPLYGAASPQPVAAVPEPASWTLVLTGFAAIGLARRRAARPA